MLRIKSMFCHWLSPNMLIWPSTILFLLDIFINILQCPVNSERNYKFTLPDKLTRKGYQVCNAGGLRSILFARARAKKWKQMKIKRATLTYCSCEYKLCARSSAGAKRCGLLFGAGCHLSLRRTGQIPSIFPGLLPEYLQGQVWAVLADP